MILVNKGTAAVCRACMQVKPVSQFHTSKYTETGITKYCKQCGVKPGSYSAEARYNQFTDNK